MKVAIVADTHYGVRGDDPNLRENQKKFMSNVLMPTIKERGINRLIHLGDLFDRRKYVNFVTATACWDSFVQPLKQAGVETDIIVGNHDCYYRNTNSLNSISTLYGNAVSVVVDPELIDLDGRRVLLAPWICDDNKEAFVDNLAHKPDVVLGHLELNGFDMYRGQTCEAGMDPTYLSGCQLVLSGHFHTRSKRGNIEYVGSTGQYTWADHGDPRGFVILDTDTLQTEYIDSPYESFTKVVYDDSEGEEAVMARIRDAQVEGRYVKIVVAAKNDPFLLERVIDKVEGGGVVDLQVIENNGSEAAFDPQSVRSVDETDTLKVLTEMVQDDDAKATMKDLYVTAQSRL